MEKKVTFFFSLKMCLELFNIWEVLAHLTRMTVNRFIAGQIFTRAQEGSNSWMFLKRQGIHPAQKCIPKSLCVRRTNPMPSLHTAFFSLPFSERWWHCEPHGVATARLCSFNRAMRMMQTKLTRSQLHTSPLSASEFTEHWTEWAQFTSHRLCTRICA